MASELDVSRQTLHNWAEAHPEFLDALTRAKTHAQRWWEDAGQSGLFMPAFNASVYGKSMAARFPEDWRESRGLELTGKGGGPVQSEVKTSLDVSGLSIEQLRAIASIRLDGG